MLELDGMKSIELKEGGGVPPFFFLRLALLAQDKFPSTRFACSGQAVETYVSR